MTILAVQTVSSVDADFARIVSEQLPTLVKGEAASWPAFGKWNLDYLAEVCGTAKLPVRFETETRWWNVQSLCRAIAHGDIAYGVDWSFEENCSFLLNDLGSSSLSDRDCFAALPEYIRPRFLWMYIGGAGSGSQLHQDVLCTHGWMAVLYGKKKWRLFPPGQRHGGDEYHVEQDAGDVMFVPSLWWHEVSNLEPTIGLTRNFSDIRIRERILGDAKRGQYKALGKFLESSWS